MYVTASTMASDASKFTASLITPRILNSSVYYFSLTKIIELTPFHLINNATEVRFFNSVDMPATFDIFSNKVLTCM